MNSVVKKSTMACSLLAAFMVPASEALGAAQTSWPRNVCKVAARLTCGATIGAATVFLFNKRLETLTGFKFESKDELYAVAMAIYAAGYETCHHLSIPGVTVAIPSCVILSKGFVNTVGEACSEVSKNTVKKIENIKKNMNEILCRPYQEA